MSMPHFSVQCQFSEYSTTYCAKSFVNIRCHYSMILNRAENHPVLLKIKHLPNSEHISIIKSSFYYPTNMLCM